MQAKHLVILFLGVEDRGQCPQELKALATFVIPIKRTFPHHKFLRKFIINKIQPLRMLRHWHRSPSTLNGLSREQVIDLVEYLSQLRACKYIRNVEAGDEEPADKS